jgi:type I restriction enzyme S subunit
LGEMYVVHFCNFDWLVKKAWMLLHPAHLTSITQNCTSFLNSPFISEGRYKEIKASFGVPKEGDILLTAIGTIGEIYVVEGDGEFYFKDGNVLWLKNFTTINPHFLRYALVSFVESLNKISHGAAYSALPIQRLNAHKIFVPSPKEQSAIVSQLDFLAAETQRLASLYQRKLAALDELKKSLLYQAFSGAL